MKNSLFLFITILTVLSGCIQDDIIDDFVEPTIRITTQPDTIMVNSTYQFEYMYLNNIGVEENVAATWSSDDTSILEIDNSGLATAISIGSTIVRVSFFNGENQLEEEFLTQVGASNVEASDVITGNIQTTSSYVLEGDFTLTAEDNNLLLEFGDDYVASSSLPGLYLYLSNNRNTIANAMEISAVDVFSGAHSYTIDNVGVNDYQYLVYFCKPFNVKVGDGEID